MFRNLSGTISTEIGGLDFSDHREISQQHDFPVFTPDSLFISVLGKDRKTKAVFLQESEQSMNIFD